MKDTSVICRQINYVAFSSRILIQTIIV